MDDVVTPRNALLEPTNRRRVEDAIRLTWTSRTKIHSDKPMRVSWIQTAYHNNDASARLREDPDSGWRWLVVRAEEPYGALTWERWERGAGAATGSVECPFPAEAVAERARRMGPTAAARALGNRPISGEECPFKPEHFEGPEPLPPKQYRRRVMFADPAGDATRLRTGDTDYCAVVAIGLHPYDKCWEVYLAERMRGSPSQQADFIARKAVQANVNVVWQEAVKDEALVEVTQRVLRDRGTQIAVKPEKPTTNKELRIVQSLEPALAAKPPLLRVCGPAFPDLKAEALAFPVAAHDDLLDALASAYAKAPSGRSLLLDGRRDRERPRRLFADMIPAGNPPGVMPNPGGPWDGYGSIGST
jgi:predicted phage terminase large subunit-like protein